MALLYFGNLLLSTRKFGNLKYGNLRVILCIVSAWGLVVWVLWCLLILIKNALQNKGSVFCHWSCLYPKRAASISEKIWNSLRPWLLYHQLSLDNCKKTWANDSITQLTQISKKCVIHVTMSETQYDWRIIEPVTMKANFIHCWCIESEFIVKNQFHIMTSELGCIWHFFLEN